MPEIHHITNVTPDANGIRWQPALRLILCARICLRLCLGRVGVLVCLLITGCRLTQDDSPLSESVVMARRLAQSGRNADQRGRFADAEILYSQACEACPVDPESHRLFAESLWRRGAQLEAIQHMNEAVRLVPDDFNLLIRRAEMRFEMGHTKAALREAEETLDLNPKLAAAWALRGRINKKAGALEQALADFHRAQSLDANNHQLLYELADLNHRLKRPRRALANLQALQDSFPPGEETPQVYIQLAQTHTILGRYDEALADFEAARRAGGEDADLLYRMVETYLLAGQERAARNYAYAALRLSPTHAGGQALLGRLNVASAPDYRQRN